jgi:group I intron endonuclease
MKTYKVYKITNLINGNTYVGYTQLDITKRFRLHVNSKTKSMPIVSAIKLYGGINFSIVELHSFDNKKDATNCEIRIIAEEKPEYNVHSGGTGGPMYGSMNGMYGKKHTQEWKKDKRLMMLGENNPMYGKTHTGEVLKKLSELKMGNTPWNKNKKGVYSEETLVKMQTPKSEEQKNKLKKRFLFVNPEGVLVEVFGLTDFCNKNGLNTGAMSEVWSGKRLSHKGWKK